MLVKTLSICLLGICLSSAWYGWSTAQEVPRANSAVRTAEAALQKARNARSILEGLPAAEKDVKVVSVEKALPAFMVDVMALRAVYGIELSQVAPTKASSGPVALVKGLSEPVAKTGVVGVRLDLNGTYRDYERFTRFLERLPTLGLISLHSVRVKDNTFSISLRVYGDE